MNTRATKRIALIRTMLKTIEELDEVIKVYDEIANRDYERTPDVEMYFYETWIGSIELKKMLEKELEKLC